MTIQESIQKANEGGWKTTLEPYRSLSEAIALALLDPLFWSALGKSMGWGIEPSGSIWQGEEKWKIRWHRLIDHLAEGGTIESYFEKL